MFASSGTVRPELLDYLLQRGASLNCPDASVGGAGHDIMYVLIAHCQFLNLELETIERRTLTLLPPLLQSTGEERRYGVRLHQAPLVPCIRSTGVHQRRD